MKTIKSYEIDIKTKYINDEKNGVLRNEFYHLTRGGIKAICMALIESGLSVDDTEIMKTYF